MTAPHNTQQSSSESLVLCRLKQQKTGNDGAQTVNGVKMTLVSLSRRRIW